MEEKLWQGVADPQGEEAIKKIEAEGFKLCGYRLFFNGYNAKATILDNGLVPQLQELYKLRYVNGLYASYYYYSRFIAIPVGGVNNVGTIMAVFQVPQEIDMSKYIEPNLATLE